MELNPESPPISPNQPEPASLRFRWLGVAGIELTYGNDALLIDPFLTRPPFWRLLIGRVEPEHELVKAHLNRCDYILVTHAHYDHLMDVPDIAISSGAITYGSPNTCKLLKACAVPDHQIHEVHPGDKFEVGCFAIHVLTAKHGKAPGFSPGHVREGLQPPLRLREYVMDVDYSYLIQVAGLKILDWSGEGTEGAPAADVLFVIPNSLPGFCEYLISTVQPRLVVPIHWDDLFRPIDSPIHPSFELPRLAFLPIKRFDLDHYFQLVKQTSPKTEIIIPEIFEPYSLDRYLPIG